ncbi:MAG: heavy metal translocating P-type ATPase [Rhodobacteraceae bacterium]|nr:heavy metal translocating P-type ATPase [Paracoccaceae bacterium]
MTSLDVPERPGPAACPGCVGAPGQQLGTPVVEDARLVLSLPTIHCAGCISSVERALNAAPGVLAARVNLTLKRASVDAEPGVVADDLITVLDRAGFEAHELDPGALAVTGTDRTGRDLLMRLGVAGFAMMNVMLLSISVWAGADDATRDLFHWISAAITLPAIAFCAQPFFKNAWSALRVGRMNMDVPIALAILLAAGTSLYETAQSGEHAYFDAAIALTFFLLIGRYLDYRTRAVARSAAEELAALEVPRVVRLQDGQEDTVDLSEIVAGDLVRVRPGGRMPVDGEVTDGSSEIDRSLLTGETAPVPCGVGDTVQAGEVNLTGPLTLRTIAAGRDSSLHALADLVAVAESGRARYSSLADKAAKLYAPGVHIIAVLAMAGWWLGTGDLRVALNIAAAVLIITCPCALGLAVPAVTTAASGRLFRKGMLIKSATALERLAEIDTVVFDKTGTLTEGVPVPENSADLTGVQAACALALAQASAHPLAAALAKDLTARGIVAAALSDVREQPGFGIEGDHSGTRVRLGRADWVGATGPMPMLTATWFADGEGPPVALRFRDTLRSGALQAVSELRAAGLDVQLLSGDSSAAVAALASEAGIDTVRAGVLPAEKAAHVAALSDAGRKVLMVGDGLNDTAALAAAHVSISPASGLDAARVASDVVLMGNDLSALGDAHRTARRAVARIHENFRLATIYNIGAVPLAVAGLATPLIAALAMSASSITVSLNALRVR